MKNSVGGYWNYVGAYNYNYNYNYDGVFVSCIRDREDLEGIKIFLLNNPLEINKRFKEGYLEGTLLLFSILYGRKWIVQYLLSLKDIDEEARFHDDCQLGYHNKKAIDVARVLNYPDIVQALKDKEQIREKERTNPVIYEPIQPRNEPLVEETKETPGLERNQTVVKERNEPTAPQGADGTTTQGRNETIPQGTEPQGRETIPQGRNETVLQGRETVPQGRNETVEQDRKETKQREGDQPAELPRNNQIEETRNKRFISPEEPSDGDQPLAPLILLRKNDSPQPLLASIEKAMGNDMDDIFYQGHLPYVEQRYRKLPEEKKHNLSFDEFCAVYFYTAQWDDKHLYSLLNASLTSKERSSTLPQWKHYLHYLLSAIQKIPKWQGTQDLYRGVSLDLVGQYPAKYKKGEEITWYAFSSTTTNLEVVKSFLPENKPSTIFAINGAFSGRCIVDYSVYQKELEVLLPPGSRFEIVSVTKFGSATFIQMKQVPTLEKLLKME